MSQKISERSLILIGDIIGSEKIPLGVDGDLAITPDLLGSYLGDVFDASYWPLGGAPTLTDNFALDGDGNDFDIANTGLINLESTGTITLQSDASISGVSAGTIHFTADDGVDSSDFTLQPDLFSLSITGDIDLVSDNFSVARATGLSVLADDGVDSSSLSLTPDSLIAEFEFERLTITTSGGLVPGGLRGVWLEQGDFTATDSYHTVGARDNGVTIYSQNDGASKTGGINLNILNDANPGYFNVYGSGDFAGLGYDDDYSVAGLDHFADRWIPDVGYVNSLLSGGSAVFGLASYTVATLPVTAQKGLLAFCEDESGGEVPVFTNNSGTWLKITDGSPPVGP